MPIHFTFLLLFSLTSLLFSADSTEKIHFTFEVLQAKNNYRNVLEKRADELAEKDFSCHIATLRDRLSLRCNDIEDFADLAPTIEKFKDENITYNLVNLTNTPKKNIVGKQMPLYIGYRAYEQKNYSKALDIFYANYREKKSLEHAKAYALALSKLGNYQESIEVLKPYSHDPKVEEIYQDGIVAYIDLLIKKSNFVLAKEFIAKAELFPAKRSVLNDKLNYMNALELNRQKRYDASSKLILSMNKQNQKEKELLIGNLLALSAYALESKDYAEALNILKPYRSESEDIEKFSQKIIYYRALELGWKSLDNDPQKALNYFKKCYESESSDACIEGQMYSYDRLHNSAKSIVLAKELYAKEPKDKYLKILISNYMKEKNSSKAMKYYALLKDRQGVQSPKGDQGKVAYSHSAQKKQHNDIARLIDYSKNKAYSRCYTYAKKLSNIYKDININRIGGWCAYHDNKYETAEEFFEYVVKQNMKSKVDDIYALALSAHKANNDERADEVLRDITDYGEYAEQISLLYRDMGESRKAKDILVERGNSSEYETQIRSINKSTKYPSSTTQTAGGLSYYRNKGTEGKEYLEVTSLPLDIDYLSPDGYYLYGDFDLLRLSNGILGSANYKAFGFGQIAEPYHISQADSFEGVVGFKSRSIEAEIGFTPIGFNLSPQLTGKLYTHYRWEKWDLHAALEQQGIKQSFLSYAGQSTDLDGKRYDWGRVLKQGVTMGLSLDGDTTYTLDLFYYPKIYGENIIENSEKKAVATATYHTATAQYAFLDFGAVVVYDSFDTNSNLFTYGHGGYFSPQNFWLGSMVVDVGNYIGENGYYRFQGALGYQAFTVDDTEQFPIAPNPLYSSIQEGYDERGVTIKASLQLGYAINDHLNLSAGVSWEKLYGYDLLRTGVSISYHFGSQKRASLKRLRDASKINQIIP
ncbi:MAG: cellulose synthase subunit BcsC-related outer membrane protein [Campylobacterota bacterium]|nr:cellulose synthase subunit BcsC-related outer membrane protein [Campylobacterota bacterium]